ncbi:DUF6575 domain-containing protein [Aeromonas caviae]
MYHLSETHQFGRLEIVSEYMRFDIPRTFLAQSPQLAREKKYVFVNWVEEKDECDGWYYITINEDEKNRLENGSIQLRDIYLYKNIFYIETPFDTTQPTVERLLTTAEIDQEALPDPGYGISLDSDGFSLVYKDPEHYKTTNAFHEVRIYRNRSARPIEWNAVQAILGAWGRICEGILRNISERAMFLPFYSEPGSYKMMFKTSNNEGLLETVLTAVDLLSTPNADWITGLKDLDVDPKYVEELINALTEHELQFDLRAHTGTVISNINFQRIPESTQALNQYNQIAISSAQIPQANDINRIIRYIDAKATMTPFTSETEQITSRQVSYYETAAKILGFVNGVNMLTPVGYKLHGIDNQQDKLRLLRDRFEQSLCGWAWMQYNGAASINEVDPDSATEFLTQYSIGLSQDTARRRAATLRNWAMLFREV